MEEAGSLRATSWTHAGLSLCYGELRCLIRDEYIGLYYLPIDVRPDDEQKLEQR
jgi:hypothetical protein